MSARPGAPDPTLDPTVDPGRYLSVAGRRLYVFVPALMSVGFAFWLGALARDALRRHGDARLERRARVAGPVVAELTRTGTDTVGLDAGLRRRRTYLLWSVPFLAVAGYVGLIAARNYSTPTSGVAEIGWLLALSLAAAVGLGLIGGALLVIGALGPRQTATTRRLTASTVLGTAPGDPPPGRRPNALLTVSAAACGAAVMVLGILAGSTSWLNDLDESVADWVAALDGIGWVDAADPLGSTLLSVVAASLLGLASFRCRPLLLAYPAVVVGGLFANRLGEALVERDRPPSGANIADFDSFPSGHMVQLTLLVGLLPMTLQVLTRRTLHFRTFTALSVVVVAASGLHRIRAGAHWPSDVLAGILIGLALVLFAQWVVAHERWHHWCHHCPWHPEDPPDEILRGAIPLSLGVAGTFRLIAHLAAFGVTVLLAFLALTRGLPVDTDGVFLDENVQRQSQLGLAGLVSVAAVISWRWEAAGAILLAIAATGLGVFAAVQYAPITAFALTFVVLIPAVMLWLSWQHHRTAVEMLTLAAVTIALMAGSWVAIREVHASTLGPTHPDSRAVLASVDAVEWVWSGGVGPTRATVVARVAGDHGSARLVVGDGDRRIVVLDRDLTNGLARFDVEGLEPATHYPYQVEVDGEIDEGRGTGSFRTPDEGPMSFTFVAGSCARSGTNGAVFDALAAEDPLFFLQLGDLFYDNIDRADRELFDAAFDRHLTTPGPAEFYRHVPIAYVWDDHDYGPDNADASSPTRELAQGVFRELVPSHPLASGAEGPIHRAFTVGRVRFVVTDTRSSRTETTMLGEEQLAWLLDELVTASRRHPLVVWANPTPWVGAPSDTSDLWAGRAAERATIADEIAAAGIDNLLMVSGDAHMLAFDDGTNTGYQHGGGRGFPLIHAAALDRPGSVKGGPYSGETFPGGGQYARIDVHDDGESIRVDIRGLTWDGATLIEETLEFGP